MKLDVVIELAPDGAMAGPGAIERFPALARLLARGDRLAAPGDDPERCLATLFGIEPDADLPNAALLALGEGLEAGGAYWLRADPVCLIPTGGRLALNELAAGALAPAEAQSLAAALRDHLAADDVVLFTPQPQRWYLRLSTAPDLKTLPPAACAGTLHESDLPSGADSAGIRRTITELQMLLNAHPVNAAREAAGKLPANAIWPWGGGRLPRAAKAVYDTVWSDDPLARGLAGAAGVRLRALPADAGGVLAEAAAEHHALVVLRGPDAGGAAAPADFERTWFEPLHAGLKKGILDEVAFMAWLGGRRIARRVLRAHLRRWWRSSRTLLR